MEQLNQFNQIINEFNDEVNKLKSVSDVYQKISKLAESYNNIIDRFYKSSDSLQELIVKHTEFQNIIKTNIDEIQKNYEQNKSDILTVILNEFSVIQEDQKKYSKELTEDIETLRKENRQFYKDLEDILRIKLSEINENNKKYSKELSENIETFRKENRQFYKDLEDILRIKLSENKSEIKQLIEFERTKNKELFEEELNKTKLELKKSQKTTFITILIFGIAIIISLVILFLKK